MAVSSITLAGNSYAASPSITINNNAESLYVDSGTKSSADGTIAYDSAANTLTLNNFHGDDIYIQNLESLTILLNGKNTLTMATKEEAGYRGIRARANLKITGTGSLSIERTDSLGSDGLYSEAINAASLNIESTTLNINVPEADTCLYANEGTSIIGAVTGEQNAPITINSSDVTLSCDSAAISQIMVINGGKVKVNGGFSGTDRMKYLEINNGELTVNGDNIVIAGGIKINKGTVNVHGKKSSIECGIELESIFTGGTPNQFVITGGNLNIDGVACGIGLSGGEADSYIKFSGGTTRITAKDDAIKSSGNKSEKGSIIIEENMYLLPEDRSILSAKYVSNYYYIESKGEEVIITDDKSLIQQDNISTDEKESSKDGSESKSKAADTTEAKTATASKSTIKAPDTGVFSSEGNELIAITVSVVLVVLASGAIALSVYAGNRISHRVKFNK